MHGPGRGLASELPGGLGAGAWAGPEIGFGEGRDRSRVACWEGGGGGGEMCGGLGAGGVGESGVNIVRSVDV